ncbi:MAG TPA: SpoIIE family protein phosphatase [Verrucomicrobiae bacterium]
MSQRPARTDHRISLHLEIPCEFAAVRTAVAAVRDWLAEKSFPEAELGAWELALIEAANNAVKYAEAAGREYPVSLEVVAGEREVEVRVTDHTPGFEWPAEIKLPADEAERGRGLYLMQSLTDKIFYLRSPQENCLVLRRARPAMASAALPDISRLQQKLAEAEGALGDMTAELATSYESLVALFRYSSELGTQTDLAAFTQRLFRDLIQLVEADGAVLRLVSADGKKLETHFLLPEKVSTALVPISLADDSNAANQAVEMRAARSKQDVWFSPEEPLDPQDPLRQSLPLGNGVCHAFFAGQQLIGTATLGRVAANKPFTAAQLNLLHTFVDFLAIQIVNARLLDERTATRVTRRELEIAADIQRSLLPAQLPDCAPFEITAACQSALQVGGDFYDVIPAVNGSALLVIADVMGKGVPAAFFAAILRSTIRAMPHLFAQPGELLAAANEILAEDLSRVNMFITAKVVYIDAKGEKLICASAGHCPLLVSDTDTSVQSSGMPLGIEPKVFYPQRVQKLSRGTMAMMFTDGLSETANPAGQMLGEGKLRALLQTAAACPDVQAARGHLLQALAEYRAGAPLADDQTFILIRHI